MLHTLELLNFRSYEDGLFGFEDGVNIIVGPNASGKTNLLQAIHALGNMKAFGVQSELLMYGQDQAKAHGVFDNEDRTLKITQSGTELIVDGVAHKRISAQKRLPIVVFQPDHMLMLSKEPELRRQYIDDIISHYKSGYTALLRNYKRALLQRNKLLKQEHSTASDAFVWDMQLVDLASEVVRERKALAEKLNEYVSPMYHRIAKQKTDDVEVVYETPHIEESSQYADAYHAQLKKMWPLDKARGFTGVGPHRDDLSVKIRGRLARDTASRGELRSLVLSLKLYELDVVREQYDKQPILLLDDVFGELAGSRRKSLANALTDTQTFVTSTDADVIVEHFSDHNIIPL